jgi:hypothetical protein
MTDPISEEPAGRVPPYTTELPTKPGPYFASFEDKPEELVLIDENLRVWEFGDSRPASLANYEGFRWSGPIEPPGREM